MIESHFKSHNIDFVVEIKEKELKKILQRKFEEIEKESTNPSFEIKEGEIILTKGETGFSLDYDEVINNLYNDLTLLENKEQILHLKHDRLEISDSQKKHFIDNVIKISNKAPYKISYKDTKWSISKNQIINWLHVKFNPQPILSLKEEEVKEFLKNQAKTINIPPQKGRLELKEGKVVEFQERKKGKIVDIDETFNLFLKNVLK